MLIEVVLQTFKNSLRTITFSFCFVPDVLDVCPIDGGIHLYTMSTAQDLYQTISTSEHMTTGSFENITKQTKKGILSDEKREQINAKRRAAYRKKKNEEATKLHHEYQSSVLMSGMFL